MVERHIDEAQAAAFRQLDVLVLPQLLDIGGRHLVDEVHVPGQQGGEAGGTGGDHAVVHLLPRRLGAPVGVVAQHVHALAMAGSGNAERAGADGHLAVVEAVGGGTGMDRAAEDENLGHVDRQGGIGALGADAQRHRVHHLDGADRLGVGGERAGRVHHHRDAAIGEDEIIRGEGRAVVEGDPGAQLELPHVVGHRLPALGQVGRQLGIALRRRQRAEHHRGKRRVGRDVVVVRVDRGHLRPHRHAQRLRLRRPRQGRGGDGAQCQGADAALHGASPVGFPTD
jgi:hypothetical protein